MKVFGELECAQLEALASAPANTPRARVYFNTGTSLPCFWDGSAWRVVVAADTTQTLSNKTMTSPVLNSPTLSSAILGTPASGTLTNCAGLPLTTGVTGTLPIANGGTGQTGQTAAFDALAPTTTKGDIPAHNGSDNVRLPVGNDGEVLTADSGEASGLKWTSPLVNPMDSEGDLIVGGSGGAATKLDAGTSGQLLVSAGAAAPVWSNTVSTAKTFSALATFSAGSLSENGNATFGADADTTLTNTSNDVQVVNLSATRFYALPTTSVLAGRTFRFVNRSSFLLTIRASNGDGLDPVNSTNMLAHIRNGYVVVQALQNTPTTPAHWRVIEVYDEVTATLAFSQTGGFSQNAVCRFIRHNKQASVFVPSFTGTATSVNNLLTSGSVPTGFVAADDTVLVAPTLDNGSTVASGMMRVASSGVLNLFRTVAGDGFTNGSTCGLAQNIHITYRTT